MIRVLDREAGIGADRGRRAGENRSAGIVALDFDVCGGGGQITDDRPVTGALVQLFHEYGAFFAQSVDNKFVVHDFVPDIDRCAPFFDGAFDDFDGTHATFIKSKRLGSQEGAS